MNSKILRQSHIAGVIAGFMVFGVVYVARTSIEDNLTRLIVACIGGFGFGVACALAGRLYRTTKTEGSNKAPDRTSG